MFHVKQGKRGLTRGLARVHLCLRTCTTPELYPKPI